MGIPYLLINKRIRGMLRRTQFPRDPKRPTLSRVSVLDPEDLEKALHFLNPKVLEMVLVAALTGVRWGELVAIRIREDVDFRTNKLRVTRALYRRNPQAPKSAHSIREIDMCPTVRHLFERAGGRDGLVFSVDGKAAIGNGSWIKRQWKQAQVRAGVGPIRWHDLRHEFVSLLIAAGKHPKYIASQAGHGSAGFTPDRYGHLLERCAARPVEWIDDLLGGSKKLRVLIDGQGEFLTMAVSSVIKRDDVNGQNGAGTQADALLANIRSSIIDPDGNAAMTELRRNGAAGGEQRPGGPAQLESRESGE